MKDRISPECQLIAAVGTPLAVDESLEAAAFTAQLDRVWSSGVHGVFVAGTMGVGPLLADATYHQLVEQAVDITRGKGNLMIGASDLSFARTMDRIKLLNRYEIGGVVVLPPYFLRFSQEELIAYYSSLADASRSPLYLYDLPQRTYVEIEATTALTLAEHPNIAGIKCSGDLDQARELIGLVSEADVKFHVIVAQPSRLHDLVKVGVTRHLDGIYSLAPQWAVGIVEHTKNGRDDAACRLQSDLSLLLETMRDHGGISALTVLMNSVGISGQFAPRPFRQLTTTQCRELLAEPIVLKFLESERRVPQNNKIDMAETGTGSRRFHVHEKTPTAGNVLSRRV
ncbi:dihydrodipicolinate synthase family protein [Adhaeretor mobilis]|uniref:4-hydroxy-tetrahydrodipicolinate synthase n=1 Tax=Adhaeretor mobilis TaxID=1930276 RepID=A0A517MW32_9BACT|nr:dihydrodipicolinate synthase family protein [Adhaeretor mobilis]QDS99079.1 4-hydroxy-tetrahydrodipicolinate synthase [Adhaeretor mobilis]